MEQLKADADFFGIKGIIKIISEREKAEEERKKKAEATERSLKYNEKAADLYEKADTAIGVYYTYRRQAKMYEE